MKYAVIYDEQVLDGYGETTPMTTIKEMKDIEELKAWIINQDKYSKKFKVIRFQELKYSKTVHIDLTDEG